jgi:hypothetical protein
MAWHGSVSFSSCCWVLPGTFARIATNEYDSSCWKNRRRLERVDLLPTPVLDRTRPKSSWSDHRIMKVATRTVTRNLFCKLEALQKMQCQIYINVHMFFKSFLFLKVSIDFYVMVSYPSRLTSFIRRTRAWQCNFWCSRQGHCHP